MRIRVFRINANRLFEMDDRFLRDRAYPWCREVGVCMEQLLKPNGNGILVLPLSSSPEVFNNSQRAWLEPNSNYDLMCLRMLFLSLVEMADAVGRPEEVARWQSLSDRLGPYHLRKDGTLWMLARTGTTLSRYLEAVEGAANAVASLTGPPLPERP